MTGFSRTSPYEFARTTGRCMHTDRVIEPCEEYIATICERAEDDGFDRFDFSLDAWQSGARPERLFSYWKTTLPEPTAKTSPFVDDELLLNLFHRLADEDQAIRIAFRFVIMLILLRKRLVKHVGTVTVTAKDKENQQVWQVRLKGDDPDTTPIDVIDPDLDDEQVREVSDQLGEILQGQW